jgi:hypothetical protein
MNKKLLECARAGYGRANPANQIENHLNIQLVYE